MMHLFHRSKRNGFTLIEIMLVIVLIALVAAMAIPNLLRARHNANETAAVEAMRTLSTSLESYRAAQAPPQYPAALDLLSSANPPYVPVSYTAATSPATARQGYYFIYTQTAANTFTLQALPETSGTTGTRGFYVDETGVIRASAQGAAGPRSPDIQ